MIDLGWFDGVLGVYDGYVFRSDLCDLVWVNLSTKEEYWIPLDY